MKLTNFIATTLILSQSLVFLFPQQANAQLSCQGTVNRVVRQIRSKGVSQVRTPLSRGTANEYHPGNPTNRQDVLSIIMAPKKGDNSSHVISNILGSGQLMKAWANSIVRGCGETAVVSFGLDRTDWIVQYAVQADMNTKLRKCVNQFTPVTSWNETQCLME